MDRFPANAEAQEVVERLIRFIGANYARRITLDSLARHVHMNQTYVSELFKLYTGIGYAKYLANVRIEHSQSLLLTTDDKISAIGQAVGYAREASFRRAFQRSVHMSPSEYREHHLLAKHSA